ncbi:exodeoxyribonuclease VII large subunit [uncultured Methanoregula sp.]|uniref:exodeoxyribonuclease VII large subunit n=1 Tax=uncultured Methanoregula sp. TaxID=1005933 RepID=UPI002AAAD2E0|nr:exodeoxyribonuclease VII large subunit [uncultured Methanoregula sp.]
MDWFNTPEEPVGGKTAPLRVSELSAIISGLLDDPRLQDIRVRGEITNYKHHGRGHRYFSLSEKGGGSNAAVIKCVMWRSDADRLPFDPEEGMEVVVSGSVTLYAPHGAYQLQVKGMEKAGLGEKYLLVEKWKKELNAEGLFSQDRKRELPAFPQTIGVVTSETGAVIHDIRNVVERRCPVEIIISPTAVQGEGAHREIARAITRVAGRADVVIVARGGGSFEDLFEFNHPDVVRAIAACPVPVVSAIGHEVDVTLADLAADVRAPTPSAAAELVVPDRNVLLLRLQEQNIRLGIALQGRLAWAREEVEGLRDRLRPQRFMQKIAERKQGTADLSERLERAAGTRIGREHLILSELRAALEGRNPRSVLARGYCVAERDGKLLNSTKTLSKDERLILRFYDGSSQVIVERVDHDRNL